MTNELTLSEIVELYHLNPHYTRTLRRLVSSGRLSGRMVGKTWVVRRTDAEHWMANRRRPGRPPRSAVQK